MKCKIVHKVEPGMDRHDILCTTYQMRNFYRQFGDGFFSVLDVMNYIQHHQIVKWCKPGNHVLDVCCGRGLLLPLLRYQVKELGSYTGVDIEPKNATFLNRRVTTNQPVELDSYYQFPVRFVEANVGVMAQHLPGKYDVIVYTSAIEHMHHDLGMASLEQCHQVSKPGSILILTCPNTPEEQDGYDTQYKAHVYEWKRSELLQGLDQAGFDVLSEYGLLHNKVTLQGELDRVGMGKLFERCASFIPSEWLIPVFSPMFPKTAKEIGFICKAR